MAKEDAAEQVKEVLRQVIKYRFWISVGFAALFAIIAYYMGAGPVQAKANTERNNILQAEKAVQAYSDRSKPTPQYAPIVAEKTEIVTKDVNKAWKELYNRQAPLLTWPDIVQDRIKKWGRQWPENEDPGKVSLGIVDYIEAYPAYVDMVYKTFNPFDYETGKGIVAAPPKESLLGPATFSIEKPPTLGKVWAAQERLWIQRTLLEVVAEVNKKARAKDWDTAILKEIVVLQVGNPDAQDQRSVAKGQQLEEAPDILSPAQKAAAEASAAGGSGGSTSPMAGMMTGGPGGKGGRDMMSSMMAGRGGGGGGAAGKYDDTIFYVKPEADKGQYKILPVSLTVLIDQDHVQDLLVELENSPMAIDVKDISLERPPSPVAKPEKGEHGGGYGMSGGMAGMMSGMGRGNMMMQQGLGGMASQMRSQMMRGGMGGMAGGMGGMGGMNYGSGSANQKKKVDTSKIDREKERKKKEAEFAKSKGPILFDPYFNIIQVTVYGQARFYNAPPAEAESPASPGDVAAPAEPAAPATGTPAGGTPAAPGTATAPAEKAAATAAPDAKPATPKPEAAGAGATTEPAKPADAAKPAAPPAEPAKPDTKGAAVKK